MVSTLLPLIRSNDWWIRWFDFPRLQILILGVVAISLQLVGPLRIYRFRALILLILFVSVGYQAYRIFPYTPLCGEQVKNAARDEKGVVLRIVIANVLMYNRHSEKYLQIIAEKNPDLILSTETDHWWLEKLNVLDQSYPYQVKYPLENTYGMILYSKFPLINPSVQFLIEPVVPSIHCDIRLPGGHLFHLVGLHPQPPGPVGNKETTERDAELIVTAKIAKRSNLPFIVLGDLNDVAWSHTTRLFQKISGLLDPRIGRGMYNTFHAGYFFIRFPLDHIFHSSHFKYFDMQRLPYIGSDHFPIYAALSFNPRKDVSQQPPAAKSHEKKEADKILEDAQEKKNGQ